VDALVYLDCGLGPTKVYLILLDTWYFGAYRWRACSKRFQTL